MLTSSPFTWWFGAFMVAVKRGGGFAAFSSFGDKHFDTPRKAKLITWLLSGIVINQGFGTIGVGAIMQPVRTSRRSLARSSATYLSSTAEPVVALVPITIYILVFGGLIPLFFPNWTVSRCWNRFRTTSSAYSPSSSVFSRRRSFFPILAS